MHPFHVRYSQPFTLRPTFPFEARDNYRLHYVSQGRVLTFAGGGRLSRDGPSDSRYSTFANDHSPGENKSGVSIEFLNIVIQ